jgi:single-stranded-DNA-specific exonuclease
MAVWKLKKSEKNQQIGSLVHPVIRQLLFQRGLNSEEEMSIFLTPQYERDIHDPFLFSEMKKVVERLGKALKNKEKVAIFGDYDADGITSTIILQETLFEIGFVPEIYIPDKRTEGYGLNQAALDGFKTKNISLIITVDCGIANAEEIEYANSIGIDVIVVDHHHIPERLPEAFAIINPHMENCGYPFKNLAGVGVAFKLVQALYAQFLSKKIEQSKWLLDLVAIGTVADCVPLIGENRAIVAFGLVVLSKTKRVGLEELFQVGRIEIDEHHFPRAEQISFQIAPRINAAGRMDHANIAYNLLVEKNRVKARGLALELESKNQERQKATARVVEEVRALAKNQFKEKKLIFAESEHFPIGVVGLAAGKIAEEFYKPTVILQKDDKTSRGSLRSIPELSIISALEKCSKWLIKFGGHHQAAGILLQNENLKSFYECLDNVIEKELQDRELTPFTHIEMEIKTQEIDMEIAEVIQKLEPFGSGNPEPVFMMKKMIIHELKTVGSDGKHLKLFLRSKDGSPKVFEAIGFRLAKLFPLKNGDEIDIIFTINLDNWNGNRKLQLKMADIHPGTQQ